MLRTSCLVLAIAAASAQDIYFSNNVVADPPTAGISRMSASLGKTDVWSAGGRIASVVFRGSVMIWCDYDDATSGIYASMATGVVDTPVTLTTDVEAVHGLAVVGDNLYYTDKTAGTVVRARLDIDEEAGHVAMLNTTVLHDNINQPVGIVAMHKYTAIDAGLIEDTADANAVLLVASYGDGNVYRMTDNGLNVQATTLVTGRSGLRQMLLEKSSLYMVEAGNSAVSVANVTTGEVTNVVSSLTSPNDIAINGDGLMLIADDVDNALLMANLADFPITDGSSLPHLVQANATRCVTIHDFSTTTVSMAGAEVVDEAASFVMSPSQAGIGAVVVLGAVASALVAYRQIRKARTQQYMPL